MRLLMPEAFRARPVVVFAATLFLVEIAQGTDAVFALLVTLYIALWTISYNVAGGIFYPSGAFVFFSGLLSAVLGLVYKAFLGEPAESVLLAPRTTMGVYCLGMATMGLAAYLSRLLRPKRALLAGMAVGETMKSAAIGCMVIGEGLHFFSFLLPNGVFMAIQQINRFSQMAILLAVYYELQRSGGRRSTNWIVYTSGTSIFVLLGLLAFSKEGMFAPIFAWLLPCLLLGYYFPRKVLAGMAVGTFVILYYLVPYAQVARNYRPENATMTDVSNIAIDRLANMDETRLQYKDASAAANALGGPHYYQREQGLMDRLQMLAFDDRLVEATERGSVVGIAPTLLTYANLIPRYFYPDKPTLAYGNLYGREIGVLGTNDETTGISFSPSADAFHQARWWGVLLIVPFVMFLLFFVIDSLTGDARKSPWGLLPIAIFAHMAPEGLIGGAIYMTVFGALMVLLVAGLARYVMPIFGKLLSGGDRVRVRRTMQFTPRRLPTPR